MNEYFWLAIVICLIIVFCTFQFYKNRSKTEFFHHLVLVVVITLILLMPMIRAGLLWKSAENSKKAWELSHKVCTDENKEIWDREKNTQHMCMNTAKYRKGTFLIWVDMMAERSLTGLLFGSTYSEMMDNLETAHVQKIVVWVGITALLPLLIMVVVYTYIFSKNDLVSDEITFEGNKICFNGMYGKRCILPSDLQNKSTPL